MQLPIVVNLVGGPGAGKSSCAAAVYSHLKFLGINCELVREVAKDLAWQGLLDGERPVDELYILAKQNNLQHNLVGCVDVIITDAPLMLKHVYPMEDYPAWHGLVKTLAGRYNNCIYSLERKKDYVSAGRVQTEQEAKDMDEALRKCLNDYGYKFDIVAGNSIGVEYIVKDVVEHLKKVPLYSQRNFKI